MEVGKEKEDLILNGIVKIKWGKKYVNLLDNNGNLNVANILKYVPSSDDILKPGLYLTGNNEVILFFNEVKVKLSGEIIN